MIPWLPLCNDFLFIFAGLDSTLFSLFFAPSSSHIYITTYRFLNFMQDLAVVLESLIGQHICPCFLVTKVKRL